MRNGGKSILKDAARGLVPDAVIDRPKGYFPVPALKYLRGAFLEFVRDALESPRARQRGLFQRSYVERLLSDPEARIDAERSFQALAGRAAGMLAAGAGCLISVCREFV